MCHSRLRRKKIFTGRRHMTEKGLQNRGRKPVFSKNRGSTHQPATENRCILLYISVINDFYTHWVCAYRAAVQVFGNSREQAAPGPRRSCTARSPAARGQLPCSCSADGDKLSKNCRTCVGDRTAEGRGMGGRLAKSLIIMIVRINNNGYFCGLKLMKKNYATI